MLLEAFDTYSVKSHAEHADVHHDDEDDEVHHDENDEVHHDTETKRATLTKKVDPETKRALQQLCVLLAGATTLIFVRTNYLSTAIMIQKLLLNYNILFAKLFPNDTVRRGFDR